RNQLRETNQSIEAKDSEKLNQNFGKLKKIIDRAASNRIIHKNAAARYKSRLAKKIKALALAENKDTAFVI
ncbi:MAG: hypothetical protein A2161_16685, partial [Candidatus Schekmanbacteria bacterium RBG_13_48_7]